MFGRSLPNFRELRTLRDAVNYITKLPRRGRAGMAPGDRGADAGG